MYLCSIGLEVDRRPRHVETPDASPGATHELDRLFPVRLEVGHPVAQRHRVVLAQRLDVTDLEAGALHDRDDAADLVQLPVREDVEIDEPSSGESRLLP